MLIETHRNVFRTTALVCSALLVRGNVPLFAQQPNTPPAAAPASAALAPGALDSLVAPIALYPDPLLAQVLAASTYPLELVQLQQWLEKHKGLNEKALADAVQKENWDPSIQSMAALPDVVKQLVENIKWTAELGNAFLAQQSDVMDAVQRMRTSAKDSGKLQSSEQMKVETKVVESKSVIVIEQANPQVVYVPSYNPAVIWGAPPVYAYPPYYPPAGYYAAGVALSFGVGIAMGAMWGGGWGYNAGWAAIITSTSITTTPSSTTPIEEPAATTSEAETATGSIVRSTAAERPTETVRPPIGLAAHLAAELVVRAVSVA